MWLVFVCVFSLLFDLLYNVFVTKGLESTLRQNVKQKHTRYNSMSMCPFLMYLSYISLSLVHSISCVIKNRLNNVCEGHLWFTTVHNMTWLYTHLLLITVTTCQVSPKYTARMSLLVMLKRNNWRRSGNGPCSCVLEHLEHKCFDKTLFPFWMYRNSFIQYSFMFQTSDVWHPCITCVDTCIYIIIYVYIPCLTLLFCMGISQSYIRVPSI